MNSIYSMQLKKMKFLKNICGSAGLSVSSLVHQVGVLAYLVVGILTYLVGYTYLLDADAQCHHVPDIRQSTVLGTH